MGFQVHTREMGRIALLEGVGRLTLTDGQTKIPDLIHVFTGNGAKKFILNLARVECFVPFAGNTCDLGPFSEPPSPSSSQITQTLPNNQREIQFALKILF